MDSQLNVRRVYERHLDLLLAEEFACRPAFARWVLDQCHRPDDPTLPSGNPATVKVDVNHDDDIAVDVGARGENDLMVEAVWGDGWTARILVEDKLDAVLQPDQPARYLERARSHQRLPGVDFAVAVVVAPAGYLERHADELGQLRQLSVDRIADHFRDSAEAEPVMGDRLRWRADRLVSLHERRRVAAPDHAPTVSTREWLLPRLADQDGSMSPQASSLRTINTGWLYFNDPSAIVYKIIHGFVDIYLRDIWPDDPSRQAQVHAGTDLPGGFQPAEDTKSNLILRSVVHTPMPLASIWGDGEPARPDDLMSGVKACGEAARWISRISTDPSQPGKISQ